MEFYWKCQYNDGTEIKSTDKVPFKDIDRHRLEKFVLLQVNSDKPVLVLNLDSNKRLIIRQRTAMKVLSGEKESIWIVGWQETIDKGLSAWEHNRQTICFVFPDGTIEVTDGFRKGHKWFYPITFFEDEL